MIYRLYYTNAEGWHEEEFASYTEASIRKAVLKRDGITARIVGIRTTIGQTS